MNFSRQFSLIAIAVFVSCGLGSAQTRNEAQAAKQETIAYQALPKAISCPTPLSKGDVSLSIGIDRKGKVLEAKALSGPENLLRAAEVCAKTWKFENPPPAPVTKTVILSYETMDCPAAESQRGELQYSWGLRNRSNFMIAYIDGEQPPPPLYPEEERKAGIAGMMVLSVGLNADGTVKEIHVMKGLSPRLDNALMDELRPLKFKVLEGVSEMQLRDLVFQIVYHATCTVQNVYNVE